VTHTLPTSTADRPGPGHATNPLTCIGRGHGTPRVPCQTRPSDSRVTPHNPIHSTPLIYFTIIKHINGTESLAHQRRVRGFLVDIGSRGIVPDA